MDEECFISVAPKFVGGAARVSGAIKTRTDTQLNVTPSISQIRGATKQAALAKVLAQEERIISLEQEDQTVAVMKLTPEQSNLKQRSISRRELLAGNSVVEKWGYYHCNTRKAIIAFNYGKSLIKLDRPGPFYFISGTFDHCRNGQRLLVEVTGLHQSPHSPPSTIAAPPGTLLSPGPLPSLSAAKSLFSDWRKEKNVMKKNQKNFGSAHSKITIAYTLRVIRGLNKYIISKTIMLVMKSFLLTCAKAYGKAEYIPAALSRQKIVLLTATTGWLYSLAIVDSNE
ncbi:hypothetical protein Ddye_014549 [Dipteronia dyeriana]|uniref:Phytocyanin domain-containing protein n=1 Tax=Dipteronia dyeriana TaxID=168575 RepID=A0AAD9X8K6_9ROSI|nr:hypothetical protein Ddye_014549 [Dipteronia dyeriana]